MPIPVANITICMTFVLKFPCVVAEVYFVRYYSSKGLNEKYFTKQTVTLFTHISWLRINFDSGRPVLFASKYSASPGTCRGSRSSQLCRARINPDRHARQL